MVGRHFTLHTGVPDPWAERVRTWEAARAVDEGADDGVTFSGVPWERREQVMVGSDPGTELELTFEGTRVEISDHHMQAIRKGLWQVVNDKRGTAFKSRITTKGWEMAGKTGTAQVVKQTLEDLKGEKDTPWRFRDHAWFAAFAPYDNPEIAIAVLVEHGGHGGSTAAPIARQAIEFYLDKIKRQ